MLFGLLKRKPKPIEPFSQFGGVNPKLKADKFENCPMCGSCDFAPKGRAEIVVRADYHYIRQYFDCNKCGVRQRMGRRIDREVWVHNSRGLYWGPA